MIDIHELAIKVMLSGILAAIGSLLAEFVEALVFQTTFNETWWHGIYSVFILLGTIAAIGGAAVAIWTI